MKLIQPVRVRSNVINDIEAIERRLAIVEAALAAQQLIIAQVPDSETGHLWTLSVGRDADGNPVLILDE